MKSLITLLIISTQYLFAIVSVAPVEIGDNPGIHGKVGVSLETKRGNTDKDNYKASLRVTKDENINYVAWGEISAEYGKTNAAEDTNKLYIHLRHIHKITDEVVRAEEFGQFQTDRYKFLQERAVVGAGLRFRIFEVFQDGKGYAGAGALYENIRYTDSDYYNPDEGNLRANIYLAYTVTFNKDASFSYTVYYQPMYDNINDYKGSHDIELKLNIYKELYLKFGMSYNVDSKPPLGLKGDDFTQETMLLFNF